MEVKMSFFYSLGVDRTPWIISQQIRGSGTPDISHRVDTSEMPVLYLTGRDRVITRLARRDIHLSPL